MSVAGRPDLLLLRSSAPPGHLVEEEGEGEGEGDDDDSRAAGRPVRRGGPIIAPAANPGLVGFADVLPL